ncbi:VanZ family protein [Muriventricola aceti]|uniref:VanZ family protein n=1 Tax=Muriventricola aceti TaxID=2981773 RepID=UPI00374DD1FD
MNRWYWVLHGMEPLFPPVDWQIQWDTLQLTPFQEIIRAFRGPWVMFLMVANIGIFCPIGFFPALLWRGWRWWKSALVGLCTSVFIEFVQFFIGRSSDVDDVILNTAGTLVGFWIFWLINALLPQLTIKFQCTTKELPGYG